MRQTRTQPAVNVHNVVCGVDGSVDGKGMSPGLLPRNGALASGKKPAALVAGASGSGEHDTELPEARRRDGGLP